MVHTKLAAGIASAGRVAILAEALRELTKQTRPADCVFICPASEADFDVAKVANLPLPLQVIMGPRGLCAQRNTILKGARDFDLLVFFDDDFFPSPSYLEEIEACLASDPSIVLAHGHVIADGSVGPGIDVEAARAALLKEPSALPSEPVTEEWSVHGCNMALRMATIREHDIRFDENLPLYSWLEDLDISRKMKMYGRVVRTARASGVHLGFKSGRISQKRYGYSQIANPIYLWRKGVVSLREVFWLTVPRIGHNLLKLLFQEPWIDRRGRAVGHWLAIWDIVRGRLHPSRIFQMKTS
ncbi:MAG TPA: glycosyltransferase family 2 protein [Methylocella sp.]|nr:glycosyltransferase family 2 protein [Methylocella sp.]